MELGLLMLLLSAIVVLMSLAASWSNRDHGRLYLALVLFLEAGLFGTFTAFNFIHWFFFWELSLIPAFFLIRLWGGAGRGRASTQFFVYSMVGSIALLLAFLAIFVSTGRFDFIDLTQLAQSGQLIPAFAQNLHWHHWTGDTIAMWIFCGAFLGFAVKIPIMPFHTWLPSTYAEAPSATTMLLTGAMSKMGLYGLLRILLPIFPEQTRAGADAAAVAGRGQYRSLGLRRVGADGLEAHLRLFIHQPSWVLRAGRLCRRQVDGRVACAPTSPRLSMEHCCRSSIMR